MDALDDAWFKGIVTGFWSLWVFFGTFLIVIGAIKIGAPFPGVAGHVHQAVAVRREGADRRGAGEAVLGGVVGGEFTLPDVAQPFAAGFELVPPAVQLSVQAAAGGKLPFRLGGQPLARPFAIGHG